MAAQRERMGHSEVFQFTFAKQLKEKVQMLAGEKFGYRPWEIRQLTIADISRIFGKITMPTRKLRRA